MLHRIKPQEKYYAYIRDMAVREWRTVEEYGEQDDRDLEYALYGLANFKKKEDIRIIKDLLLSLNGAMSESAFELMQTFPDTAYLEVFENYYSGKFYSIMCITGRVDKSISFIQSVASYKTGRSAKILESILNKKPFARECTTGTSWLKQELIYAIWNNPCAAYAKLRKQIEASVQVYEKNKYTLPSGTPIERPAETTEENIMWWWP